MGKRIIRLTEADIEKIVKKVILEQDRFRTIKGTTSPENIASPEVLKRYGLPVNDSNYKGVWKLDTSDGDFNETIGEMFKLKNLSLFDYVGNSGGGNFIEFKVRSVTGPGERPEEKPPIRIENGEPINADILYKDSDGTWWRVYSIEGSGNGLLALGRALKNNSSGAVPNRITLILGAETRESGEKEWNANKINNIQAFLNSISSIIAHYILKKSGAETSKHEQFNYIINENYSVEDIACEIARYIMAMDKNFLPEARVNTGLTCNEISKQIPIETILNNLTALSGLTLNQIINPVLNDLSNAYDSNPNKNENVNNIFNYIIEKYNERVDKFISTEFPGTNFTPNPVGKLYVGNAIENAINGIETIKGTDISSVGKEESSAEYELGK